LKTFAKTGPFPSSLMVSRMSDGDVFHRTKQVRYPLSEGISSAT
jgi:hypothetical protein